MITAAYQGDPTAHAEVMKRFPVLVRSRLPRTPRTLTLSSNSGEDISIHSKPENGDSGGQSDKQVKLTEDQTLVLYVSPHQRSFKIGEIDNDSQIISIRRQGQWSEIMISTGVPTWIFGELVEQVDERLVKVVGDDVNLRLFPYSSKETVFGEVNEGDILQIIANDTQWYQVFSPADNTVWVRTHVLDKMLR